VDRFKITLVIQPWRYVADIHSRTRFGANATSVSSKHLKQIVSTISSYILLVFKN